MIGAAFKNHLDPAAEKLALDLLAHMQALMPAGQHNALLATTGAMMAVRNAAPSHFKPWTHAVDFDLIASITGSLIFGQAAIIEAAYRDTGEQAPPSHQLRAQILNHVHALLLGQVTAETGPMIAQRVPATPKKEAS